MSVAGSRGAGRGGLESSATGRGEVSASRLRVACWSPLPPQRSGIADYCAELAPHLARHVDLELIHEDPAAVAPVGELPVRSLEALRGGPRCLGGSSDYDLFLYQLGNDRRFHGAIHRTLLEQPGVVVLHEAVIHHLVQGLTLGQGNPGAYLEAMRSAYGLSGEAAARRAVDAGVPADPWSFPLFEPVVDASLGLIVHSDFVRRRVLASRPRTRVRRIPHHLSLAELPESGADDRAAARRALNLPEDALVVASYGFVTRQKRIGVALRAFARLRARRPDALFFLVGDLEPGFELDADLVAELGDGLRILQGTDLTAFLQAMVAADLAINLRYPTGGETSGTLIRLLGMGKPVLVSDHGSFAEVPDGCCGKVPLDAAELDVLTGQLLALAEDEELRRELGDNARRHMARHHTLAGSAAAYGDFLERIAAQASGHAFPSWVPPVAPLATDDLFSRLGASFGADLVDLGLDPATDGAGLAAELAEQMVDLGLDSDPGRGDGAAPAADGTVLEDPR